MDLLTSDHIRKWNEGSFFGAYNLLGSYLTGEGARFAVWAPHAEKVSVVGDFNGWDGRKNPMQKEKSTGIWSTHVPAVSDETLYKYEIHPGEDQSPLLKTDPYARYMEVPPDTASKVYQTDDFQWNDRQWMRRRTERQGFDQPVSIYEVHLGSWKRNDNGKYLTYRELARELIPYVKSSGFTHIELMPIAEHPHDPSWGYQITGFFAPTSRFGEPDDFRHFVNECHKHQIGVIMDWVPGHFPKDEHGLQFFDGTPLYENTDPKNREQRDWGTFSFDYGKKGVRNFLLSNACYWCEEYHVDGLRVDAVASMLYLDYSKGPGDWTPNRHGGKENLEAISFLRDFNEMMHRKFPGVLTFAEESTSWPGVTDPADKNGLGFDYKWNMGWMNDTLSYLQKGEDERRVDSNKITFPMMYNASEQFVLPLSHDEVVHLKKPLLKKSPGTFEQQLANLRLLLTYLYGHPGKKLLFMGGELAAMTEWSEGESLDWELLEDPSHQGVKQMVHDLNRIYRFEPSLHQVDREGKGFEWVELGDNIPALFAFLRKAKDPSDHLLFTLNFSGKPVDQYFLGPFQGLQYRLIFNSDSEYYGGANRGGHYGSNKQQHIHMPPYSAFVLKPQKKRRQNQQM